MILQSLRDQSYDSDIVPFIKNGIIVDTCAVIELIDGLIDIRFSGGKISGLSEYGQILSLLDFLKIKSDWSKLYITPHILTEICRYFRDKYSKWYNYQKLVKEVFPILELMGDLEVLKSDFLNKIDLNNPVIEAGDISIFVTTDEFTIKKEKVAVLTVDLGVKSKYVNAPYVLVMDYKILGLNSL